MKELLNIMPNKFSGQVYKIHSDFYYVNSNDEIFECKIREVLKKQDQKIYVGDFVDIENGYIYPTHGGNKIGVTESAPIWEGAMVLYKHRSV